ncbi:MAG: Hsp70 family protein [Planctomycetota bacterium]|nr:Hsp70 family protein [Planctomycetota bacterium]
MSDRACNAVGIDLGTTYSALAYMDNQLNPHVVQDSSGQAVTPSVVFFDDDEVIVGDFALQQAKLRADRIVQFVKVHMGDDWKFTIDGQVHTPESISAMILAHLIREAEFQLGKIDSAVITVPAYFTEKRRRATQQAGEIAGLNVIGTLNEPMSAALAHRFYQEKKDQTAVVYDLGGGTFDVTVVKITPGSMEELATLGNRKLGGKEWDQALVDFVADDFKKQHGKDPRESQQALQDLMLAAEQAKRRLGRMKKAPIKVQAFDTDHVTEVSREQFEHMTAHLVQTTKLTTQTAIEDAGLDWSQIDKVVLVGGSTHMPMVQRMLADVSGRQPESGVNPVLAVALGAAHYAYLLEAGNAPEAIQTATNDDSEPKPPAAKLPSVRFVTAHGVGIKTMKQKKPYNSVLIHKNSQVPCSASREFRTVASHGKQKHISVVVTQGDTTNMDLAEVLGKGRISDLPDDVPDGDPVRVTMSFDEQGRLHVHALYVKTDKDLTISLEIPGGLAEEEVKEYRQMLRQAGLVRTETIAAVPAAPPADQTAAAPVPTEPPPAAAKSESIFDEGGDSWTPSLDFGDDSIFGDAEQVATAIAGQPAAEKSDADFALNDADLDMVDQAAETRVDPRFDNSSGSGSFEIDEDAMFDAQVAQPKSAPKKPRTKPTRDKPKPKKKQPEVLEADEFEVIEEVVEVIDDEVEFIDDEIEFIDEDVEIIDEAVEIIEDVEEIDDIEFIDEDVEVIDDDVEIIEEVEFVDEDIEVVEEIDDDFSWLDDEQDEKPKKKRRR